jgi:hypothetical protein
MAFAFKARVREGSTAKIFFEKSIQDLLLQGIIYLKVLS